ncbi:hypothetical protein, partial [Helicobacter sp. T3_23-1059]
FSKADIVKAKSSVASLAKAKSNNAIFASAKSTYPQTPSAREGALIANATTNICHTEALAEVSQNATKLCHTERSEVSLKNINCHEFATFNKVANSRNDGNANSSNERISTSLADSQTSYPHSFAELQTSCPPSLAEGARGWVSLDSTSKISLHNLKADSSKADIAKEKSNNAIFASAKSTHPQTPSAREGASFWASSARDGVFKANVIPKNAKTTPKKRLALSLATSAVIASLSIETAAAWCQWKGNRVTDYNTLQCIGTDNGGSLSSNTWRTNWGNTFNSIYTVELGNENTALRINGGTSLTLESNLRNVRLGRLTAGNITLGGTISGKTLATIGTANVTSLTLQDKWDSVSLGNGSTIGSLTLPTTTTTLTINGGALIGNKLSGTVGTLSIGDRNTPNSGLVTDFSGVTINNNLLIYSASIVLDGSADTWKSSTTQGAHIYVKDGDGAKTKYNDTTKKGIGVANNAIYVSAGDNIVVNEVYKYEDIIRNNGTSVNIGLSSLQVRAAPGQAIKESADKSGFSIVADVASSYGASVYRALVLSSLRRNTMAQNILDTMTTKTFHSDRYYNQEVELRLLQYDLSRLTNRSSKFSKQTRKNTKKVDKVREKMARLTLEQSKGQILDKGYNNYELIDQLDAIFIPYTGRRDWRFFALPYATYSYVDFGNSTAMEYAGGALFGVQRNLRANGIFGGYVGYEFVNTDTALMGTDTRAQTNSVQAGLNYFKTFSVPAKVWEGFIKANIRGGVDLPTLNIIAGGGNSYLKSNDKASSLPLMYSVGAEVKGGVTFYQYKRNSYLSPEVSLSYDMLSALASKIDKPEATVGGANYRPLGASEFYNTFYWHLPQIGAALRYYKMWGNTFRTNLKAGIKYNVLNKQKAYLSIGALKDSSDITLPAVYGNVAFDMIWMIKKNHELSFGVDAMLYASTFSKANERALNEWFNGVSGTANFKYAYWFGGSDYVTDKDGNAVARNIVEGGKKSKKSKKSKKKKEKKSKKKVYYIDG